MSTIEADPPTKGGEQSDFEYSGLLDGDMRFLSCTRCGALVAADARNITRHSEMHREHQQHNGTTVIQNIIQKDDSLTGDDLAELLRQVIRAKMREDGVTQLTLSDAAGVSQKHLSQMLTGGAAGSLKFWNRIVAALGCEWSVAVKPPSSE